MTCFRIPSQVEVIVQLKARIDRVLKLRWRIA